MEAEYTLRAVIGLCAVTLLSCSCGGQDGHGVAARDEPTPEEASLLLSVQDLIDLGLPAPKVGPDKAWVGTTFNDGCREVENILRNVNSGDPEPIYVNSVLSMYSDSQSAQWEYTVAPVGHRLGFVTPWTKLLSSPRIEGVEITCEYADRCRMTHVWRRRDNAKLGLTYMAKKGRFVYHFYMVSATLPAVEDIHRIVERKLWDLERATFATEGEPTTGDGHPRFR